MLSKSKKINENYAAQVIKVKNVRMVPKADRLKMFTYQGSNILSTSVQEDDVVVYFPVESQIMPKILHAFNLYRDETRNKDAGTKGYFEDKGRVKAVKLMKVPSEGFVLPASEVAELFNIPVDHLKIGEVFDSINDEVIVKKYVIVQDKKEQVVGTGKNKKKIELQSRMIENQFNLHRDTPKLAANIWHLIENPDQLVWITWKLHGTSTVSANVLTKKQLPFGQRIFKWLGADVVDAQYDNVYSSRKVIKNEYFDPKIKQQNHFYGEDIWSKANNLIKDQLLKGETVYGEIVGYLENGGYIQKDYDYKCEPGKFHLYIYRITQTNVDGKVIELNYDQIAERAEELGVSVVPLIWKGNFFDLLKDIRFEYEDTIAEIGEAEAVVQWLKDRFVRDQDSIFCDNKVPEEGICFTINGKKMSTYKLKSSRFLRHESKELDSGQENIEG